MTQALRQTVVIAHYASLHVLELIHEHLLVLQTRDRVIQARMQQHIRIMNRYRCMNTFQQ